MNNRQNVLVASGIHLTPVLIPDTVVDSLQGDLRKESRYGITLGDGSITRHESATIPAPINQGMDGVTICLQTRNHDLPVLVTKYVGLADRHRTVLDSSRIYFLDVVDLESNILHSVTVLAQVTVNSLELSSIIGRNSVTIRALQRRCEDKADGAVLNNMRSDGTGAGLETTVRYGTETHAGDVIRSSLFGIPDIPVEELANCPDTGEGEGGVDVNDDDQDRGESYQCTWS